MLPGLPEIFIKKFEGVLDVLPEVPDWFFAEIFTRSDETEFAAELTAIQDHFSGVEIGSYPTYDRSQYAARITLKSESESDVRQVFGRLHTYFLEFGTMVKCAEPHKMARS